MRRLAISLVFVAAFCCIRGRHAQADGDLSTLFPKLDIKVDEAEIEKVFPLITRLPADANCYCYRLGWDELKPKLAGTATLDAVSEPGVQEFFKEVRRIGERGGKTGPAYNFLITASFQTLVLAGKPLPAPNEGEPAGPDTLYGLAVQPSEAGRADFAKQLDAARASFEKSGLLPPVRNDKNKIEIAGTTFQKNGEDDKVILSAWDGQTLYLAGSDDAARWLASQKPDAKQSLAGSEFFASAVSPLFTGQKSEPIALYYHDLRPFWGRHETPFWQAMSWRSIESAAGASFIEGRGFRNRHYLKLGEKRTGLFRSTKGGSVNQEWLKRIPPDATAFMAGYWDVNSLVLSGTAVIGKTLMGVSDDALEGPGIIQPLQPLLDNIGPRFMYYRVAGKYGALLPLPVSDMVVVMELKDAAAFGKGLEKLMGMAGEGIIQPEPMTMLGHKVTAVNLMYITVYFTTIGNDFILTFHPQMMKDALTQWDKPDKSVLDTPDWKAASGKLVKDPCFIFYIAPNGFARGIYDRYIPVMQQLAGILLSFNRYSAEGGAKPDPKAAGFNLALLPRGCDLGRHVTEATIMSAHDDGTGVLFDGYAPLLSTPYYWVGVQASVKPFNFGPESLIYLLRYMAMPAEKDGAEKKAGRSEYFVMPGAIAPAPE
jgi:hypothetical protein